MKRLSERDFHRWIRGEKVIEMAGGFGVVDWTASLQDLQLVSSWLSEGFFADF